MAFACWNLLSNYGASWMYFMTLEKNTIQFATGKSILIKQSRPYFLFLPVMALHITTVKAAVNKQTNHYPHLQDQCQEMWYEN